jgi:uncharacterized protein YeaO (DUF488 family)
VPLRTWFGHIPARFSDFRRKYEAELSRNPEVSELRRLGRGQRVTLLYAAGDPQINHAQVLRAVLENGRGRKAAPTDPES